MTRLEQLRLDRGLTPDQLSELADVARGTIIRAEQRKPVRVSSLVKLAAALDARPSELQQDARPLHPSDPSSTKAAA